MPIPSLQLRKKDLSHAEKQRVWSRSCGLQEVLQYTDTSSALCLHHAHPFVAAAEKYLSHAEQQRICSRSCGVQDLLQWWYETAANQRTLVEIELLATVGWKWGCQPFSCPCLKM